MKRISSGGGNRTFEKVAVDEWLSGVIEEVQLDEHHKYKKMNQDTEEWEETEAPHVRFKFALKGYKYPHYSRWLKASTHKKSNLYGKYLKYLCPNFDCEGKEIDIERLEGIEVKTMWETSGEYQNLVQIRALEQNVNIILSGTDVAREELVPAEDQDVNF